MFAARPRKKDTRKDTDGHFQRVLTSKRTLIDTSARELICTAQYDHFRDTILGGDVGKKSKTALVMASRSMSSVFDSRFDRFIKPIVLAAKLPVDCSNRSWDLDVTFLRGPGPFLNPPYLHCVCWPLLWTLRRVWWRRWAKLSGPSGNMRVGRAQYAPFYRNMLKCRLYFIRLVTFPAGKPWWTAYLSLRMMLYLITSFHRSLGSGKGEAIVPEEALSLLTNDTFWDITFVAPRKTN